MSECDMLHVLRSGLQVSRQSSERFLIRSGILGEETVCRDRTVEGCSCAVTEEQYAAS